MLRLSIVFLFFVLATATAQGQPHAERLPRLSDKELLIEVQKRAVRFFWEKSNPTTGLTNDRAKNSGEDDYTVGSTASTGYALAALPIGVKHGWLEKKAAYDRALLTLKYLYFKMPQVHGWFYHFIDSRTGERVWNSELSSIDTTLLMAGVLVCGQYWRGTEVEKLANDLYDRMDWTWMRTNGGTQPQKMVVSHGWSPERGFITNDWDNYCELMTLYLLGMGSRRDPLPVESWSAWKRNEVEYGGRKTLAGGAIFMHQMAHAYFNFKDVRDSLGWDYHAVSIEATQINRQFCADLADKRKSYAFGVWGINANDAPDGYRAYSAPGLEDGTISPTGAISSLLFTPKESLACMQTIYTRYGHHLWGRYGFGNAFNIDKEWYGPDVIGIDLGMALLAIEDYRSGFVWRLMQSHPSIKRAWELAGFRRTREASPRPMYRAP